MKEFFAAVEETDEPEGMLEFKINGQQMKAYRPTDGQFALLMMALGRHATDTQQVAGVIDFFFNILDEPSQRYMASGLSSRTSMVSPEVIVEILYWMIEEWTGRPFKSPFGSTSSPPTDGQKSTPTTTPSRSLASALTGS